MVNVLTNMNYHVMYCARPEQLELSEPHIIFNDILYKCHLFFFFKYLFLTIFPLFVSVLILILSVII